MLISGNRARSYGAGVFDGEDDRPLANIDGTTTKYFVVSSGLPSPMRNSMSRCEPTNQVGKTMTLSLPALSVP